MSRIFARADKKPSRFLLEAWHPIHDNQGFLRLIVESRLPLGVHLAINQRVQCRRANRDPLAFFPPLHNSLETNPLVAGNHECNSLLSEDRKVSTLTLF